MQHQTHVRFENLFDELRAITQQRLVLDDDFDSVRISDIKDILADHEKQFSRLERAIIMLQETLEWEEVL